MNSGFCISSQSSNHDARAELPPSHAAACCGGDRRSRREAHAAAASRRSACARPSPSPSPPSPSLPSPPSPCSFSSSSFPSSFRPVTERERSSWARRASMDALIASPDRSRADARHRCARHDTMRSSGGAYATEARASRSACERSSACKASLPSLPTPAGAPAAPSSETGLVVAGRRARWHSARTA